jgi:LacI family transcriptional regulator
VALGALLAARELGLQCPKDISIIGFDNLELGMFTDPALSSVNQPGYQMGARAARLLLERIKDNKEGIKGRKKKGRAQRIVLPTELRLRNSVGPKPE